QSGRTAFECRNALLEDVGRRIHDPGVDVSEFLQRKESAGVVGILEQIRGGLVDRHRTGAGGGIRGLTGMNGEGGKLQLLFVWHSSSYSSIGFRFEFATRAGEFAGYKNENPNPLVGPGRMGGSESVRSAHSRLDGRAARIARPAHTHGHVSRPALSWV